MPAKPDPRKILDEAMQLEPPARAFIAETLLESLDLDQDFAVSQEWLEEIRRRCAEIDSGTATLIDGDRVINELREKYSRCLAPHTASSASLPAGGGRDTQMPSGALSLWGNLPSKARFHRNHRGHAPATSAGLLEAKNLSVYQ